MAQTVLILGMNGRFGRNAAEAFQNAGWDVRGFRRDQDDLVTAAQGVDVIVNAWNPPYSEWAERVPALHRSVCDAARASGSFVIVPGNVYVFGADTPSPWGTNSPHAAQNPLGRIRIEMEQAYRDSGVRTLILRAGDFLDTEASGNWFDRIMAKDIAKGRLVYPGRLDIPHAWAYLPDLTRAAVALAEKRDQLDTFTDVGFPGFTLTGEELRANLSEVTGHPIKLTRFGWHWLALIAPFSPMMRCLQEMRYLWDTPHHIDGAVFKRMLPEFEATPLQTALKRAIAFQ